MAEKELPFPEGYYPFDKSDMKKVLDQFPAQVRESSGFLQGVSIPKVHNVYYFGMGGSGIAGDLLSTYFFGTGVRIHVTKGYDIPDNIPQDSLLLFSSYSGNTEETLSCYKQAVRKFKNIISLSSGGKLEEMAKMNRYPHISLPKGYGPPRTTLGYQFFTVLFLFEKAGMISVQEEVKALLKNIDMRKLSDMGVDLSGHLKDCLPLVYASERYYPVAYRWKTQMNENAKVMAFSSQVPEMNHNELVGYSVIRGKFYSIILKFDDDHRRIQHRMELMKGIMKRSGVEVTELALKGQGLTKMFTAILIGDYTSYYLALRYKIDPTPVKLVEKFKGELGPFV